MQWIYNGGILFLYVFTNRVTLSNMQYHVDARWNRDMLAHVRIEKTITSQ